MVGVQAKQDAAKQGKKCDCEVEDRVECDKKAIIFSFFSQ